MSAEPQHPVPVAAPTPRPVTASTVDADHAGHARAKVDRLTATLLRTKSVAGRRVLARLAVGEPMTPEELERLGRAVDVPGTVAGALDRLRAAGADPEMLSRYAHVIALQTGADEDVAAALGLWAAADRLSGGAQPTGAHADTWAQLLLVAGRHDEARSVLRRGLGRPEPTAWTEVDLLNPFLTGPDGPATLATVPSERVAPWLAAFDAEAWPAGRAGLRLATPDELFAPGWLETYGLRREDILQTPFDLLAAQPAAAVESSFRVTVIMSAYNPGRELLLAARSVVAQTWQNWELLVVDDASPSPTPGVLEAVEAMDPRIRVIRKGVNGGTYRCRNTALRLATGDAFIVHDSDDWAHPQRLEAGARALLTDPTAVASRSQGLRIGEDLRVTRPGYPGVITSAASLMVRLVPGVSRVGFFDTVRKAADTEYARRLEAAFGDVIRDVPGAFTLLRTSDDSLSAADFSRGWRHGSRAEYKNAYATWHDRIARGEADPFLDPDEPRPFAAPVRWSSATRVLGAPRRHIDVVVAGDWRRYGGPQRSMMEEIRALVEAGHRVGVLHVEALRFATTTDDPLCEPVQRLIDAGTVEVVHLDDDVDIDVLLLRYPPILQYPPLVPQAVRPARLLIVANQAPAEADGSDQRYSVPEVEQNARELFGVDPVWVPQGPTIRRLLEPFTDAVAAWDDPGLIDADAWQVRSPDDAVSRHPVVGRYSRDDRIKFPTDLATIVAAYDYGPGVEVRMMGAPLTIGRLQRAAEASGVEVPAPSSRWRLIPHGKHDVRDFLGQLDLFVYVDNPDAHEAFGRTLLEAAASGVPVITTPKHRDTFGDLLLYAQPEDIPLVVHDLLADRTAYRARVQAQLDGVRQRYSHEAFARTMADELEVARAARAVERSPEQIPATRDPGGPATVRVAGLRTGVEMRTEGVEVATARLRRAADAEAHDSLHVLADDPAVAAGALAAATRLIDAGEDDARALEAAQADARVRAVILVRAREVAALVPRGATAAAQAPDVVLTLPAGPADDGLVWGLDAPRPARVTVRRHPRTEEGL